jgi:hypothetical protein
MAQQQPAPPPKSGRDDADKYGRLWYELGPRQSARRVLESPLFLEWVRRPVNPSGRGGGILEPGNTDVTRTERQLLFSEEDAWRFESGAGYHPMLISEAAIPTAIYAALMYVHDQTAGHAYGPGWRTRVRGISIQITQMDPGDDRGDHNDSEKQGEFIASYTAQGSCDIRLCYAAAEPKPPTRLTAPDRRTRHRWCADRARDAITVCGAPAWRRAFTTACARTRKVA